MLYYESDSSLKKNSNIFKISIKKVASKTKLNWSRDWSFHNADMAFLVVRSQGEHTTF